MRHAIFLFILFLSSSIGTFSQTKVIFEVKDLKLSKTDSDFLSVYTEKNDFGGYLLIEGYKSSDFERYQTYFDTRIEEFKKTKRPKKEEKYVKGIHEFVKNNFLRIYSDKASFYQLFEAGFYNNITACAIYRMTFEALQIPYAIKRTLSHAYIVAYPDTHQILIETTDLTAGYGEVSQAFKQNFVSHLIDNKLIEYEQITSGYDHLFKKYYFTDKNITPMQLLALHYYNKGLESFEEGDVVKAFEILQKSHVIYPASEINKTMLMISIDHISKAKYDESIDYEMLSFIPLFEDEDIGEEVVVQEFYRALNNSLINRNDTSYASRAYMALRGNLNEKESLEEVDFAYNYERGRVLYNKGKYIPANDFIVKAYKIKPNNTNVETLLTSNINNMFVLNVVTNEEGLDIVENLFAENEGLKSNVLLSKILLSLYLYEMADGFDSRDSETAKNYQEKFESFVESNSIRSYNEFDVGRAYSKGVIYYFRKGWYKSAKSLVNQGLKYAPDNSELRNRKYMLNSNSN
ncbi:MAG: hypothetical protein JXR03_06175 [Cyclobacteriaceae bacterium]